MIQLNTDIFMQMYIFDANKCTYKKRTYIFLNFTLFSSIIKSIFQMSHRDDSVFLRNEDDLITMTTEADYKFETAFCDFRAKMIPFTKDETGKMIEWIVNNQAFHLLEGDTIWKRMELSGLLEERSWKSMKTHFHKNVLSFLDETKVSREVRWKLEACLKNPDAVEFFCDADIESEPEPYTKTFLVNKVKKKNDRNESKSIEKESSGGDDDSVRTPMNVKKFVRKRSKIPADKFDESIRLSSFSTRSSIDLSKENDIGIGVEPSIEALLDNSNIPQLSHLRDSSGASRCLDISKPMKIADITHLNKSNEKLDNVNDVESFVDDIPTVTEFSAGLKEARSRGMSQERERSLMGVTSTVRNDEKEGCDISHHREEDLLSDSNDTRRSAERAHPALEPEAAAASKKGSTVETAPRLSVSSKNSILSKEILDEEVEEYGSSNLGSDVESNGCNDESIDGVPKDVSKLQQIDAQLGFDKEDQVYLVVKGLPKHIDFENVEFVRASRNPTNLNDDDSIPESEKRKLKVICVDSGNSKNKSKEWKKKGPYEVKFRTPYSKKEDWSIINFLKDWKIKKGNLSLGGNRIWKSMEKRNVCNGRSWESMKERWRGYLAENLEKFNINSI